MLEVLALENDVFQRCLSAQPAPTALQRSNRCKCAHLLRDLAATADLPPHSALFLSATAGYLTHRWSLRQRLTFALNSTPQGTLTQPHFSFQIPGSQPAPSLTFSRLSLRFLAGASLTTFRLCTRLGQSMKLLPKNIASWSQ